MLNQFKLKPLASIFSESQLPERPVSAYTEVKAWLLLRRINSPTTQVTLH